MPIAPACACRRYVWLVDMATCRTTNVAQVGAHHPLTGARMRHLFSPGDPTPQDPAGASMRIVFMTCPPGGAAGLLRTLVEERLVAGGNIVAGVRSIYRWKGQIEDEPEEIVWMETATDRVPALITRARELHPYKVPKILTFDPLEGPADYLGWVRGETRAG
jgi:periplasmic divalent cation tolerance protein